MADNQDKNKDTALQRAREAQARAEMYRERFYDYVVKAIDELPDEFRKRMENVDIIVADWPSAFQLSRTGIRNRYGLLGLYEGIPRTVRNQAYNLVLPDKITIFRKPIEAKCRSWEEIEEEVGRVVRHEIAHHFGTDEATLRRLEGRG